MHKQQFNSKNVYFFKWMCVKYQCSSILKDQMFDAGLHSDVGSDQQLQSTDCWEVLRDRQKQSQ